MTMVQTGMSFPDEKSANIKSLKKAKERTSTLV